MSLRVLVCCLAAALAGCASNAPTTTAGDRAAAEEENDCLRTSLIRDWDVLDQRSLIVYESRRPYHVELGETCFGLDFATMIAVYDRSGDGRICGYGLDRVIVDRTIPESCSVAAVDELTDEQATLLKRRAADARALR